MISFILSRHTFVLSRHTFILSKHTFSITGRFDCSEFIKWLNNIFMAISTDTIDRIREAANIVDVISDYLQLKRQGSTFKGSCPFHNETKPSFTVNPERQIFRCFGCGEGGNVFTFLMKLNNMTFPEAVEFLADRYGISIEKSAARQEKKEITGQLYEVNEFAAAFFENNLRKTEEGEKANKYLHDRGYGDRLLRKFRIGYAPDKWDSLINIAAKKKIELSDLLKTGLVIHNDEKKRNYDRYRKRIIFPIINEFGKISGFGGRILPGDTSPAKYINSPESPVYQKSKLLYGLFQGKERIRQQNEIILVEGYTDVISLHTNGFANTVASSGTALTEQQGRIMLRYAPKVIILYDADDAGKKATFRGAEILLETGLDVYVIFLDPGEDPDSFFKSKSDREFGNLIDSASPFIEYYINLIKNLRKNASLPELIKESGSLLSTISKIPNNILKDIYVNQVAENLGVKEKAVINELQKAGRRQNHAKNTKDNNKIEISTISRSLDADIFKTILTDPASGKTILKKLPMDELVEPLIKEILESVRKLIMKGKEIPAAQLFDFCKNDEQRRLMTLLITENETFENAHEPDEFRENIEKKAEQLMDRIKLRNVDKELILIKEKLKNYRGTKKPDSKLQKRFIELNKSRQDLLFKG